MQPRTAARLLMLGRVAIGAALIAAPDRAASGWLGEAADRPGTQVAVASLGARDLVLGLGGAVAAERGGSARPWLAGAAVCDLADLAGTIRHRDALPPAGVIGVSALAAGAAAAGLWLAATLD
jgi:hypothetical protein